MRRQPAADEAKVGEEVEATAHERARGWLAALRPALADGLGQALVLFITLRVVFFVLTVVTSLFVRLSPPVCVRPGEAVSYYRFFYQAYTQASGLDYLLVGVWKHWDACWYEEIAKTGYLPGEPTSAFFPLYPLLMRAVGIPLGGHLTLGGLIVSSVAYIAAMIGLYRLVHADFCREVAVRTVLYISVFPTAFFLFAPFTESLFLALSVWAIYEARRGAWGWAALVAFLVGLTRTQGVLLALPLGWEAVRQWHEGRRYIPSLLVPVLPAVGFVYFTLFSDAAIGLTSFEAQRQWGGAGLRAPWTLFAAALDWIRERRDFNEVLNLVLLVLFAVGVVVGVRRLPFAYTLYAAPQLLLIATRHTSPGFSPLASTSRYMVVLFPVFVLLALAGGRRGLHYAWLATSLPLLGFLFYYAFLRGGFVG